MARVAAHDECSLSPIFCIFLSVFYVTSDSLVAPVQVQHHKSKKLLLFFGKSIISQICKGREFLEQSR